MKRKGRIRYMNPLRALQDRQLNYGPSLRHAPAQGLEVQGDFYTGGEAIPHSATAGLDEEGLKDYYQRTTGSWPEVFETYRDAPGPGKDQFAPQVGSRRQSYADPELSLPQEAYDRPRNTFPRTPEEGRANLPPEVRQHVSDEEAMQISPGQARGFIEVFNRAHPSHEWAVAARLGEGKRGWYHEAAQGIVSLFGPEAPRFAALLAATSPVKAVQDNLRNAMTIWERFNQLRGQLGAEPTSRQIAGWARQELIPILKAAKIDTAGEEGGYTMNGELNNIIRALSGSHQQIGQAGTLSGPKVDSFTANLLGNLSRVTNDTWMAGFAGHSQKAVAGRSIKPDWVGSKGVFNGGYAALSAKARMAAAELNSKLTPGERPWQPAEIQETVWSVFRALGALQGQPRYAHRDDNPQEAARFIPDPLEALDALTHEFVRGNADFITLFTSDSRVRRIADRLGLGEAIDRLAEEQQRNQASNPPLSGRAIAGMSPGDVRVGQRISRRAGSTAGRFATPVSKLMAPKGKRLRYAAPGFEPEPQPKGAVASSRNVEENLSFEDALQKAQSGDQKAFTQIAQRVTEQAGLKGSVSSAVGDWEDGAEHSVLTEIPQDADMDTLRYIGAWHGLLGNQKAVLVFRPHHSGLDSVYEIKVPDPDLQRVRSNLSKAGVPFRTIVPGKKGTRIVIYDQQRALRDKVAQFAGMYNAPIRESIGSGEYLGGSNRSAARREYRKVIDRFEAARGRSQVHPQPTSGLGGGRGTSAPVTPAQGGLVA